MAVAQKQNDIDEIDELISRALASQNFWEFCLYYDLEFFTKRSFLEEVASAFQFVFDNYVADRAIKVAVSMPPRAGKSYITSLFCAWWLGRLPHLSVMRNACTARLYQKFSYDVRNVIRNQKFKNVFPAVELAPDKQNIDGWNLTTSRQVGYFGNGVGGTIIGFGANLAISDDLYKDMAEALSPIIQEGVSMWKQSAHDSRMEKNCPEIFIGTRWTPMDEIGKAVESGEVDFNVKIPALVVGPDGQLCTFCDHVKSTKEYLKIKNKIDPIIWEAEYMQDPKPRVGLLYREFRTYVTLPESAAKARVHVDVADTGNDNLCAVAYLPINDLAYVLDVIHTTERAEETEGSVAKMANRLNAELCRVESNNGGRFFGRNCEKICRAAKNYKTNFDYYSQRQNKESRILNNASAVNNYFVMPHGWDRLFPSFHREVTRYMAVGTNKTDDGPDTLTAIYEHEVVRADVGFKRKN